MDQHDSPQQASATPIADREIADRDMRRIVDSGCVLLWRGAPDGSRRWVGPALAKFTGLSMRSLAGPGWLDAVHPADAERCAAVDLLCLAADRSYTLDYRVRRHDGHYRWVMDTATPCHDEAGRLESHVGICIDIDERRRIEDQVAERLQRMRIAGRS